MLVDAGAGAIAPVSCAYAPLAATQRPKASAAAIAFGENCMYFSAWMGNPAKWLGRLQ